MKFRFSIALLLMLSGTALFAADTENPIDKEKLDPDLKSQADEVSTHGLDFYEKNYFLFGRGEDSIKGRISIKYSMFYPFNSGIYFGYTQDFRWDAFNRYSSPFRDINFSPSGFYMLESKKNIFGDADLKLIDFLSAGCRHKSNGKDGQDSRSINYWYGSGQVSVGNPISVGLYGKYMWHFFGAEPQNKDIKNYMGNWEGKLFLKFVHKNKQWLDHEEIYVAGGANGYKKDMLKFGWIEAGVQCRILSKYFQPQLYLQYWRGYGENMLDYNKKETCYRIGVALN